VKNGKAVKGLKIAQVLPAILSEYLFDPTILTQTSIDIDSIIT
jgi:hypothetical protein